MARMQFRPASGNRGFRRTVLSTASINRMREESNRIVNHMERLRQAKEAQANKDAAAMRENDAFLQEQMERNHRIQLSNLGVEEDRLVGDERARLQQEQQDEGDRQKMLGALQGLAEFSSQAAEEVAKRKAEKLKEDQDKATANYEAHRLSMYSPQVIETQKAQSNRSKLGEIYAADVEEEHASGAIDGTEHVVRQVSNPATNSKLEQHQTGLEAKEFYTNSREQFYQEGRSITTKDGLTFSAAETVNNPTLQTELHRYLLTETLKFYGVKPEYIAGTIDLLNKQNEQNVQRATRKLEEDAVEGGMIQADTLDSIGDTESYLEAAQLRKRIEGPKAMHDAFVKNIGNPETDLEAIDAANPRGNGKRYSEEWPNRWKEGLKLRAENQRKIDNAQAAEVEALNSQWAVNNFNNVQDAMQQDPEGTMIALQQRYGTTSGKAVPGMFKSMYSAAIDDKKDVIENELETRTQFGIIDLNFVNNIDDPDIQKKARIAFNAQEEAKYGPEALGIKDSLSTTARQLTDLNPNEKNGSPQTYLVEARLKQEYLRLLKEYKEPVIAKQKLEELVDAGVNGEDKSSPFYRDLSGPNNRPVFTNIERSDPDRIERTNYINKQMVTMGASVIEKPFSLATPLEMDATYQSSLGTGRVQYPAGVLQAAEAFNLKPSEVYNAQRQVNNSSTGTKKPLLSPKTSNIIQTIDDVPANIRKLILGDVSSQVRRGGAMAGKTVSQYRRPNMGGGGAVSQRQALQEVAAELGVDPIDLATIIGFETGGSYSPDQVGGEGGNYMGLIQFGIPERRKYGVTQGMSFEEQLRGPVLRFFKDRFAGVGMSTQGASLEDLYTTVLAGNPRANRDAKDSFGTSARSGAARMSREHREAAMQRFGF